MHHFEIASADADSLLARWSACPDLNNRDCGCPVHVESERHHVCSRLGTCRYFRAYNQSSE